MLTEDAFNAVPDLIKNLSPEMLKQIRYIFYIPERNCGKTIAREIFRKKMIYEYGFLTCMTIKKYSYRFITPLYVWRDLQC